MNYPEKKREKDRVQIIAEMDFPVNHLMVQASESKYNQVQLAVQHT